MHYDEQLNILTEESLIIREFQDNIQDLSRQAVKKIPDLLKYRNYVLAVSHSNYLISLGGTEKVLHEEQAEFAARQISYIQVYACNPDDNYDKKVYLNQMVCVNVDSVPAGSFSIIQFSLILQILNLIGITHAAGFHLHHLMNLSIPGVKYLINAVQADKLRIFIHDYYTICPQFNLLRNGKDYCNGSSSDTDDCKECEFSEKRKPHLPLLKKFFSNLKADIIVPSAVAADIWKKSFPEHEDHIRVVPHQITIPAQKYEKEEPSDRLLRIAYLGYESVNKGLETWWRLTSDNNIKELYDFFHLGASGMNIPGVQYVPVSFLNEGTDAMVKALRKYQIDIAFLWSVWAETYSFTLHEAFAGNCFVITNRLSGNIAAQIKGTSRGIIFDNETDMFHFLKDVSRVKDTVNLKLKEHSPVDLKFNPQLAIESADRLKVGANNYSSLPYVSFPRSGVGTESEYLLRKLEIETHLSQQIGYKEMPESTQINYEIPPDPSLQKGRITLLRKISYEEQICRLRAELDVYHISKLHRMVEHARQYMNTHMPFIGSVLKKIFFGK